MTNWAGEYDEFVMKETQWRAAEYNAAKKVWSEMMAGSAAKEDSTMDREQRYEEAELLIDDLADDVEDLYEEREEAREVARDCFEALLRLQHDWMNEKDMLHAWNGVYCCGMPEYLRKWLRDA